MAITKLIENLKLQDSNEDIQQQCKYATTLHRHVWY